jgi:cell division protein FtsL
MNVATIQAQRLSVDPRVIASCLGVCIIGLIACYMYVLSMSVVHVVMRKEVQSDIREVESSIAALESTYIESQHQVSERIAKAESLAETNEKIFIQRSSDTLVLSRRDE